MRKSSRQAAAGSGLGAKKKLSAISCQLSALRAVEFHSPKLTADC
jgi:hypothetical protein